MKKILSFFLIITTLTGSFLVANTNQKITKKRIATKETRENYTRKTTKKLEKKEETEAEKRARRELLQ